MIGNGCRAEGRSAAFFLVRLDLGEGDAGGVIDADMDVFPTDAARLALAGAVAGDAMASATKLAKLLDVDMDALAGMLALVAADGAAGSSILSLLRPRRLRMRLTVAVRCRARWRSPDPLAASGTCSTTGCGVGRWSGTTASCDLAGPTCLPLDSAPLICGLCAGRRRRRLPAFDNSPHYCLSTGVASGGHSYARSSGFSSVL